jgi:predicted transcriptional regulator
MKQLLMSIQPQHLYNILTGKKTLEIRKQIPKGFKGWVNLYCTIGKPYIYNFANLDYGLSNEIINAKYHDLLNGKVVARFWFDEYDMVDIQRTTRTNADYSIKDSKGITHRTVIKRVVNYFYDNPKGACVSDEQLTKYGCGQGLYAMHIKSLEIFDKPKALSEFRNIGRYNLKGKQLKHVWKEVTKAPQNFMYVEVEE